MRSDAAAVVAASLPVRLEQQSEVSSSGPSFLLGTLRFGVKKRISWQRVERSRDSPRSKCT